MDIQPNTTIYLLKDVPLVKGSENTLYFENAVEQETYFSSFNYVSFTNQYYTRGYRGYIRILCEPYEVYNCNYLMFQNTNYSEKWFYAFIDKIIYVNDNVTQVNFTIDVLQTWFFDYSVGQCFIERQHTLTDSAGDNINPEPVTVSDYVLYDYRKITNVLDDKCVVVMYADNQSAVAGNYGGVFGGAILKCYSYPEKISELRSFINSQVQHPEAILGMYMCPRILVGPEPANGWSGEAPSFGSIGLTIDELGATLNVGSSLDGYVPKNNKLYTYPYSFCRIDSPDNALCLPYEYFTARTPRVRITGNLTYPVELKATPIGYKNSGDGAEGLSPRVEYRGEHLSIKGFPQCSWSYDAFAAWAAQNSVPLLLNAAATLIPTVSASSAQSSARDIGKTVTRVGEKSRERQSKSIGYSESEDESTGFSSAGVVSAIIGALSAGYVASIRADIVKGDLSTGSNDYAFNRMTFWTGAMGVRAQEARIIDNFFTQYGYAVNRYGFPSRYNRTRFTYVKTIGCVIYGSLPAEDASIIADMYNGGIRFWKDKTNIYNYDIANTMFT